VYRNWASLAAAAAAQKDRCKLIAALECAFFFVMPCLPSEREIRDMVISHFLLLLLLVTR
jgi:hypothetical protein